VEGDERIQRRKQKIVRDPVTSPSTTGASRAILGFLTTTDVQRRIQGTAEEDAPGEVSEGELGKQEETPEEPGR